MRLGTLSLLRCVSSQAGPAPSPLTPVPAGARGTRRTQATALIPLAPTGRGCPKVEDPPLAGRVRGPRSSPRRRSAPDCGQGSSRPLLTPLPVGARGTGKKRHLVSSPGPTFQQPRSSPRPPMDEGGEIEYSQIDKDADHGQTFVWGCAMQSPGSIASALQTAAHRVFGVRGRDRVGVSTIGYAGSLDQPSREGRPEGSRALRERVVARQSRSPWARWARASLQ